MAFDGVTTMCVEENAQQCSRFMPEKWIHGPKDCDKVEAWLGVTFLYGIV